MTRQYYSFQHLHRGEQRTTPFGEDAQALIAAANKAEVPFVIVPHRPSAGAEAGQRVFYKVDFDKLTVTKCDKAGVPIPAKWKGAPAGATYTHKLIIEPKPEPAPEAAPAAAPAAPSFAEKLEKLAHTFAERTEAADKSIRLITKGDCKRERAAVEELLHLAQEVYPSDFIRELSKLIFRNTGVMTLGYFPSLDDEDEEK